MVYSQSLLLLFHYEGEFEQSEHIANHERGYFVTTKSVKHSLFIVQQNTLWQVDASVHRHCTENFLFTALNFHGN